MKFLTNCIGFMAILCAVDASWAASPRTAPATDARVSYNNNMTAYNNAALNRSRRLPTINTVGTTSSSASSSKATTTSMSDKECVDAYTECIHGDDACGADFEECTTKTLFYAKKPQCNSTLLQCSAAAVNTLFGNSNITALANKDKITDEYTYPTDGSILGQFIEAGAISNRLDTSDCVKKYTSCLKKDSVCGSEFELCTDDTEFKKQRVFCESTLARCQADGVRELFGSDNRSEKPREGSRLDILITEGGELAVTNAVSTCYKVADQCLMSTCEKNPFKCMVDSDTLSAIMADWMQKQQTDAGATEGASRTELMAKAADAGSDKTTKQQVTKFIKGACLDTIGGNKSCFITAKPTETVTAKKLIDPENRDDVYEDIYSKRISNPAIQARLKDLMDKFDKKAKDKCVETIKSCAMRSCGGGVGSVCYALARQNGINNSTGVIINTGRTYNEIKAGCEALVNTDANCQYAAATALGSTYQYSDSTAFTELFKPYEDGFKDPLAVVGSLNAILASSYNDAALDKFAEQCSSITSSCIKSMCGTNYENCYRSRTDVVSNVYNPEKTDASFAVSMDKVGGVLDFTIVTGLCMDTVENAKACKEYFGVEAAKKKAAEGGVDPNDVKWEGGTETRSTWLGAVSSGYSTQQNIATGKCTIDKASASPICKSLVESGEKGDCNTTNALGCLFSVEEKLSEGEYFVEMAANDLFQRVLGKAEREAQAQYNAKITKEQQMCLAQNNGGVMGKKDMTGSTYQWVKLNSNKVPNNYTINGLSENSFKTSNDLYGSFCRVRVTVQSDDPDIKEMLQKGQNWSTAYFAVGDPITCGAWIPQSELEKISETAACKNAGYEYKNGKCNVTLSREQKWATALSTIGAAGAGYGVTELLQRKTGMGGLLGSTYKVSKSSDRKKLEENLSDWEAFDANGHKMCDKEEKSGNKNCYVYKPEGTVAGFAVKGYKKCTSDDGCSPVTQDKNTYVSNLRSKLQVDDNGNAKNVKNNTWIASTVVSSAASLATGLGVGLSLKAKNNEALTEAQKQWLDEIGSHIVCYVGADEAGTYGDTFTTSLE